MAEIRVCGQVVSVWADVAVGIYKRSKTIHLKHRLTEMLIISKEAVNSSPTLK